jgi:hypothetical protein
MQSADSIPNVLISRVFLTAEVLFRFGLSAMFLLSAISKAINPLETVGAIKVVLGFSGYLADCGVAILIVSEVVLSFLLVFSGNRRKVLLIAALVLIVFSLYLVIVSLTPTAQSCGCGVLANFINGSIQKKALFGVARNTILIILCVSLRFMLNNGQFPSRR